MEVTHPQNGFLSGLIPSRIGICNSWNFWLLRRGKTGVPGEKPLRAKKRTNNKLNSHMTSTPGFELGPHRWEESTITITTCAIPCFPKPKTFDDS